MLSILVPVALQRETVSESSRNAPGWTAASWKDAAARLVVVGLVLGVMVLTLESQGLDWLMLAATYRVAG